MIAGRGLSLPKASLFPFLLALLLPMTTAAKVIQVPQQQPTIQAGIDAASNGDTVQVSSGAYVENISFNGKAITVTSVAGPRMTTIDGGQINSVVTFDSGETTNSILRGFTIQNGAATQGGGGILIDQSSPTIEKNIIENNTACGGGGGGVYVESSSAVVKNNIIRNNAQGSCSGGLGGGGIALSGAGAAQIIGNTIEKNTWDSADGGGISINGAGIPTIMNNVIFGNYAYGDGGGISDDNGESELIIQNLIVGNSASHGAGIYLAVSEGQVGPLLINNTVANNVATVEGSALYAQGFDNQVELYNNIFIGSQGGDAVYCDSGYDQVPPWFINNDVYTHGGTGLQGTCASENGVQGNISEDPHFVSGKLRNYQLEAGSPAINAGNNNAPDLPRKDLAKNPRVVGGTVDMGAYEYQGD
jgi:parallel beta-helix repeat protein